MLKHAGKIVQDISRRGTAFVLALVLLCGLVPVLTPTVEAASWAQNYLDTLAEWDIMRGDVDGGLAPERNITRAEFVAMMNRAYGYTDMDGHPFTDVNERDWYSEDIDIAYTVGYFNGTTPTTAEPKSTLTREQAAVLLARNMVLQPTVGETLGFSDTRDLSSWSRGYVGAAAQAGIINGYEDGSFRPRAPITRAEVAAIVARSLGTLIQDSGDYNLSSVYGNVTINESGVNLRNTVIVGNLYLTGGIGLGDVLLENVTVYGQIIVAGAGESNSSRSSVILRNVVANKLVVDNISNQFVTVRAEGDTSIDVASIRTNGYVEDTTPDGYGLKMIEIDGENGIRVQLAGNIKEVKNLTPESSLQIVQGSAQKVTIDEKATNSTMNIYAGARVDELNLDVSTSVSGEGDIGQLNVGAADCTVSMLPDNITIRPGITATINGVLMDSNTASESSADPRLLAGYPAARDIAPTTANLVASTNKAGTVYWAITALADGSVSEDNVISPPSYGGSILQSGSINVTKSKTEYTAPLSKLTSDGSYYITSIMVDGRGNRSPLKVTAFTTPDDTVPAFNTGYPVITKNTTERAQVTIMANKSCQMYYALLSGGSTAPTAQELKAGAVRGNWGYGVVDVVKNSTQPININSVTLEELTSYDLYLWLTDYDGTKSSNVTKVTFRTPDETPPEIVDIMQTDSQATSARVAYSLSEAGTLYYAIVPEGNESFMIYDLDTVEARVKVESGVGASVSGNSSTRAANTSTTFNINNLNTANTGTLGITSYDMYFVAKDAAGNYSTPVRKLNVRTRDVDAPTATLEFTKFNGDDENAPLADTDVRVVFNESVQGGARGDKKFLDLYNALDGLVGQDLIDAKNELANAIREHITLYTVKSGGRPEAAVERNDSNQGDKELNWVVDYRNVKVTMEDGKMVITFPTTNSLETSALNLDSGASYFFQLQGIYDMAITPNAMGSQRLDFTTVYAQISLSNADLTEIIVGEGANEKKIRVDFSVNMEPISTSKVDETERWDMIMWSDTSIGLEVYYREGTDGTWTQLGTQPYRMMLTGQDEYGSVGLRAGIENSQEYKKLVELDEKTTYQYAVHLTQVNDLTEDQDTSWSELITMRFGIIAGTSNSVGNVSTDPKRNYQNYIDSGDVTSIGLAYSTGGMTDILTLRKQFTDRSAPSFLVDAPKFTAGSSTIHMELALSREGTIYYVVAPAVNGVATRVNNSAGEQISPSTHGKTDEKLTYIPLDGDDREKNKQYIAFYKQNNTTEPPGFSTPTQQQIINPRFTSTNVKSGSVRYTGSSVAVDVSGLVPSSDTEVSTYYVYFVLQGGGEYYSPVECYRVDMGKVKVPYVRVSARSLTEVLMSPSEDSQLSYALVELNRLPSYFNEPFKDKDGTTVTIDGQEATLLKAITTGMNGNDSKTYFDEYADKDRKDQVLRYILGSSVGTDTAPTALDTYDGTIMANTSQPEDFNKVMTSTKSEYIVLAAARHVYGGTAGTDYGFGGVRGLFTQDTVPPEYTGGELIMPEGLSVPNNPDWYKDPTNPTLKYSGTINIPFSKEVYLSIDNKAYPVWQVNSGSAGNDAVSVIDEMGVGSARFVVTREVRQATSTFSLRFTNVTPGSQITLFQRGDIVNGSNFPANKKLVLRFDPTLKYEDYPGHHGDMVWPGFHATWE